jgi:hypothetical protein
MEILLAEEITINEPFHELSLQDDGLESLAEEWLIPSYEVEVKTQLEGAY